MFDNIGGKIKTFAIVHFIVETLAAVIVSIILAVNSWDGAVYLLIIPGGIFYALVVSWFMYGFGELIEQQTQTNDYLEQIGNKIGDLVTARKNDTHNRATVENDTVGTVKETPGKKEDRVDHTSSIAKIEINPESENIVCPICGTQQKANRNVCWHCGAKFDKEEKQN